MLRVRNIIIMKFRGWLLDVDYTVVNTRPLIRMWCIDDRGRSAVIFDDSFEPYFYVGLMARAHWLIREQSEGVGGEIIRPVLVDIVDRKNFASPSSATVFYTVPRDCHICESWP